MKANNKAATFDPSMNESDITYHEEIGRGASGTVYRVTWNSKELGKIEAAAKKIIKKKVAIEQDEIKYLERFRHPNIITYYGHVWTPNYLVIVTEYASKGTLDENLIDKNRLPLELKLKWAIQAAKGIKYMQDMEILHRDIKSNNMLIDSEDNLKICDFGLSKNLKSTKSTVHFRGTYVYAPPEALPLPGRTKAELSPTADIFAFGIVLWKLESCEEPYKGLSDDEIMERVVSEEYRPEIPASCPEALKCLIQDCWNQDRTQRPKAEGVVDRLEVYESSLQWQYKQAINTGDKVYACNWVSYDYLAVCTEGCVKVYKVTTQGSQLAYLLSSHDWIWKQTLGVAALHDSMLVICEGRPYVYEFPCHQATQEVKKYKIQGVRVNPHRIVAHSSKAAINISVNRTIVICSLPRFTHQTSVKIKFDPYDISISANNLLILGRKEMVVKPLGNKSTYVCKVKSPDDEWMFRSVCSVNNSTDQGLCTDIYVACDKGKKSCVFRYKWNASKSKYVSMGCIIDDIMRVRVGCLSITPDGGLLALSELRFDNVKLVKLYRIG